MTKRIHPLLLTLLFVFGLLLPVIPVQAATPPTPDEFAGFPIGSDGNLLRWEKIVEYFRTVAGASDRVLVEDLGKSTNGNPFIMATVSSPSNLARLDEIQANQHRLADPRQLSAEQIEHLPWNSPVVALMTCNIHSTEIASSQMALKVLHRLATEDSPWVRHVLDHVVLLLVPSFNPDGQIMVTDWNNRVKGSDHVWSPLPGIYHPYTGHDNNRDAFLMTQVEARLMNKVLYQDWFPQVYLDQHQMGNAGMRVFVPPFTNPINPNVNPIIWSEMGQFGLSMFARLHEAGFSGIGYNINYTSWWQGGFIRAAWFHNILGLLTEVASANLASPVYQEKAELRQKPDDAYTEEDWIKKREKDPHAPRPAPRNVVPLVNYPRPWLGGKWTLADIIERQLVIAYALFETAANNRVQVIENHIRLGKQAIDEGKEGKPSAYVFPQEQHDPGAVYQLLEALDHNGVEIQRAKDDFTADGQSYAAGTYVISMAQPFRNYVKDLLEKQDYPDPKDLPLGAMRAQPYDTTTWTMPLQMGVTRIRVEEPFEASLELLDEVPHPRGRLAGAVGKHGFLVRPGPNHVATAVNRFLKQGAEVYRLRGEAEVEGGRYPAGTLWVRGVTAGRARAIVEELGLAGQGLSSLPDLDTWQLSEPRVALYQPWTASMDEGWTRWLLEQHEFGFAPAHNADMRQGGLLERWDAIILPGDRNEKSIVEGRDSKSVPEEYRGGIGSEGRAALKEFVAAGGTLITMGDSTEFALRTFELPLKNALEGVEREEFSCPGSFLRVLVDPQHPVAHGMPDEATVVFKNNAALEPVPGFSFTDLQVIARYPGTNPLQSGWMRGPEHLYDRIAAAEVTYKKGRVVLIAFRPQHRAQSHNTFKLLFNAIHYTGAK